MELYATEGLLLVFQMLPLIGLAFLIMWAICIWAGLWK